MVIKHSLIWRKASTAFTMIELIFAIVIIGLVMITIPTILVSNARHVETNLLQEAILIAATKMGQNMSYPWDENSRDSTVGVLAKTEVLRVTNGAAQLDRDNSDFRVGHFSDVALHRRMTPLSNERNASGALGFEGGFIDDIDDIQGIAFPALTPSGGGYKDTYTITGFATYVDDGQNVGLDYNDQNLSFDFSTAAVPASTNIKMIEIRVDANETTANPDMLFRSFSSNIGEPDYYKRTY
jgi:competence protein ComGC